MSNREEPTLQERIALAIEYRLGDFAYSYDPGVDFGLTMAANIARDTTHSPWVALCGRPPPRDSRYLVCSPSADESNPLIAIAWYHPDEGAWTLLPEYWIKGIRYWMEVPAAQLPKRDK